MASAGAEKRPADRRESCDDISRLVLLSKATLWPARWPSLDILARTGWPRVGDTLAGSFFLSLYIFEILSRGIDAEIINNE